MTRVLRSAIKKNKIKEDSSYNLSISKKSKNIKKIAKKKYVTNSKESQQHKIWNINSILSNIFKYTEKKDLIEFNTVCKRWNNVTNPIIHRTIMLQRRRAFQNKDHDKRFNKAAKTNAEVEMCMFNNSKHAQYIKEINFYENIEPQRAIQLFETFRFITKLSIGGSMSQDQFISMIIPLTQLQELNLICTKIRKIVTKKFISEPAVLPPSLKKLSIFRISLYKNPELFVQTINSHTRLLEFTFDSYSDDSSKEDVFLDSFFKNYPNLKTFEYSHRYKDHSQTLIKIFESNPQIKKLNLSFPRCSNEFMSKLSQYITNLEEFNFEEVDIFQAQSPIISKFTHSTNIKKLNLAWNNLSKCSLNSILLNCPYLEELYLNPSFNYETNDFDITISPSKLANIKKLFLNRGNFSINWYNNILTICARVKELDIVLPREWKGCMKLIGSTLTDLESLKINPSNNTYSQEFYESEFFTSKSACKFTLTNLTLYGLNFYESKAEYFEIFPKLNFIEYPYQRWHNEQNSDTKINFDKDLWPGYRLNTKIDKWNWSGKLVKLSSQV